MHTFIVLHEQMKALLLFIIVLKILEKHLYQCQMNIMYLNIKIRDIFINTKLPIKYSFSQHCSSKPRKVLLSKTRGRPIRHKMTQKNSKFKEFRTNFLWVLIRDILCAVKSILLLFYIKSLYKFIFCKYCRVLNQKLILYRVLYFVRNIHIFRTNIK